MLMLLFSAPEHHKQSEPKMLRLRLGQAAICSGLPILAHQAHSANMGTKSRDYIYGSTIRATAERAKQARKEADRLACEAWNYRMLGYKGPAQPSPTLGDALNAGYGYLEVRCLGWSNQAAHPSRAGPALLSGAARAGCCPCASGCWHCRSATHWCGCAHICRARYCWCAARCRT